MIKKILRFFWDNFLAGILVILPIAITIWIIRFIVVKVNSVMLNPMMKQLQPYSMLEHHVLFLAKAGVFLYVLVLIILIGLMTRVIIIRRTFTFFERLLYKLPMVNKIYGTTKEISYAFLGNKSSSFQQVVLVEYPRRGIYTLGFVTSATKGELREAVGSDGFLNIYIPTTPNPTSGLFVLFKKEDVIPVKISVEDALKVIISAGVICPPSKEIEKPT
ncbi:MAG: DUF502 domain-containing protein [Candidatus Omnitrophota bacterium]